MNDVRGILMTSPTAFPFCGTKEGDLYVAGTGIFSAPQWPHCWI